MLRKFSYVAFVILLIASPMLVEIAPAERTQLGGASHLAPTIPNFNQANRHPIATSHQKSTNISPLAAAAPVFLPPVAYDAGGSPWGNLAIADFNADGNLDMVLPNQGFYGFTVGILLGNGHGWFAPPVSYASGPPWAATWPQSVAVADVNGDDRPDLIVGVACDGPTCTESVVGVLLGNGDGSFQPGVTYSTGAWFAYAVAVADVDADGKPDVLVGNQCTTNQWICEHGTVVSVLLGNGDGTFHPPSSYRCGGSAGFYNSLAVADVNSDGKSDVVVATGQSNGYGTVAVLLGNGDGTFQAEIDYASGSQGSWSSSLAVGDINKDGKPDIAVMNYEGTVGVLLGNGDGTFRPPVNYDANGDLALVVIADVNGDRLPDLVVPTSGHLGILLGNGDGTFQPALLYVAGGGITAVADLNNDGKPDVVAAGGRINVLLTKTGVSTKTVVTTSGSPTDVGQQVTFTAKVTSSAGIIPDGELMAFYDGINALGQVKLAGGTAVLTASGLSPKTHNIGATYVGDEAFRLGSGHVQQKVLKYQTTTSLASSVNPSTYGRSVTLTARVMPSGPFPPAGTVTFKNVSTGLGIVSVNASGAATLTKTTLPVGSDAVTATYNGDALNGRSSSSAIIQTVNQAQITMTLSSSLNPCEHGQSVKFTATLTSNGGLPSGQTVTFSYNGNPLGTARIAGDKATLLTTTLPVGSDVVTATYAGDTNHSSATASVMQAVN